MKHALIVTLMAVWLLAFGSAQAPGPAPRFDAWKVIGPGGGGTMIGPTISPNDSSLVVEHCDMTGAYITHDGGQSWRMFNLRAGIETFAFDPGNPKRIYAGGAALWRSDDTGRSWRMLFPNPSKGTFERQSGDHGDYVLLSNDGNYVTRLVIRQIVLDPFDSNTVHIAFSDPSTKETTVLLSTDAGESFRPEQDFKTAKLLLLAYPRGTTLAIGAEGVFLDRGGPRLPTGAADDEIESAAMGSLGGKTLLYATTGQGNLYYSEDAGRSWEARTPALGQGSGGFGPVAVAERDARIAYVGFRGLRFVNEPGRLWNGIAKTVDGGKAWMIVFKESDRPAANLDPSWIEERADGTTWKGGKSIIFDAPYSLAVAPGNPDICYASDLFRTYRTVDGGKTWAQVNSVRVDGDRWTTRGLDVTTAYGVQFDPFDSSHMFIDYTDIGAFASQDAGRSWESATDGVPQEWRNTTYWLAFDPKVKGLMWGAFSGIHDLPRPKMWRRSDGLARYRGGVGISTDGGRHWEPSNSGMKEAAITHLLLDPASPVGRRTLYACAFGVGVYKSRDSGKSWQLKNAGIREPSPFAWRIVRTQDGTLYLIVARSNQGRLGTPDGGGALYRSKDGAEHWTRMALPDSVNGPNGLAIDPRNSRRLYLAAWGQEGDNGDVGGGVFLSTDGGRRWKAVFNRSQHVYDVTVDPRPPITLYICGFDAAAYRSTDAGLHWSRIGGYNFKWGHRVIVDPNDPSQIYIATYGGSVWHGPAAGDPLATEDILTPVPVDE